MSLGAIVVASLLGVGSFSQAWQLLELATTGLGTLDGGRALSVDGRKVGSMSGLDFTSAAIGVVAVGENFSCPTSTTGTLDFDDVRTSTTPPAAWLSASGPASAVQGKCSTVNLSLADSDGAPAPAPYDVEVSITGPLQFFEDADCATAATTLTLGAGQTSVSHGVIATAPGTFSAARLHPDFLTGTGFALEVTPRAPYEVGCGIGPAGAFGLWLLLWVRPRRRTRVG